jgi:hypothetical protein
MRQMNLSIVMLWAVHRHEPLSLLFSTHLRGVFRLQNLQVSVKGGPSHEAKQFLLLILIQVSGQHGLCDLWATEWHLQWMTARSARSEREHRWAWHA